MEQKSPKVTVAICTYNRSDMLASSVGSVFAQETDFAFEVIVIDNNSTDNTQETLRELKQKYPELICVSEEKQGLSHARNRALAEAKGEFVAYIDDDSVCEPGWMNAVVSAFSDDSVGCVGGRIRVSYPDSSRPDWFTKDVDRLFGYFDHGDKILECDQVVGANMVLRRSVANIIGDFSAELGYVGQYKIGGEEVDMAKRIKAAGWKVVYVPDAKVVHYPEKSRMTKQWAINRHRLNGRAYYMIHGYDNLKSLKGRVAAHRIAAVFCNFRHNELAVMENLMEAAFNQGMLDAANAGEPSAADMLKAAAKHILALVRSRGAKAD